MAAGTLLKKLLKANKKTIKWLSEETGIPTATLYSITKRDSKVIGTDKIDKIASALNIDAYLLYSYFDTSMLHGSLENEIKAPVSGDKHFSIGGTKQWTLVGFEKDLRIKEKNALSMLGLTHDDLNLIEKYNNLDKHGQSLVKFLVEHESKRITEEYREDKFKESLIQIPYYHQLASAGNGEYLFDDLPTDTIRISKTTEAEKADFVLKVRGDSMEPTISDGELLLIKKTSEINIGEIGIFIDQYDCYVKELGKNGLISHNKKYPLMIPANGVRCIGRVLGKAKEV